MIRRSDPLRSIAPLLLSVLLIGRLTAAYTGSAVVEYQSFPVWSLPYEANTDGLLINIVPSTAPPAPQFEAIAIDRTGHPVNGIPGAYQPKYDEGYGIGYVAGYDSGFSTGQQLGTAGGTADGRSDGYNKGWGESYQPAFDRAYSTQLPIGKEAGWNQGHIDGFAEGYDWAPTLFGSGSLVANTRVGGDYSGSIFLSGSSGSLLNPGYRLLSPEEVPEFYYTLGLDDGNEAGSTKGSTDGYNLTYPDAYAAAYPIGYENGTVEGTTQGTANGKSEGFSAGWELGYDPGFDSGFEAGVQHYLASKPQSSSYGRLEIELGGSAQFVPSPPPFSGVNLGVILGSTSDVGDITSDPSVPEPTSIGFLCVATAVVMLRRLGRK